MEDKSVLQRQPKSYYSSYYMLTQNYAPKVLLSLGKENAVALKILLYLMNHMDRSNYIENISAKEIQKAFMFYIEPNDKKPKTIAASTIYKHVKILYDWNILDKKFSHYLEEKYQLNEPVPEKIKSLKASGKKYTLNPNLVWNSYLSEQKNCYFPTARDMGKKPSKVKEKRMRMTYYMINKQYENDWYYLAQKDMNAVLILFYFIFKMDEKNELVDKKICSYEAICEKCGLNRQSASVAIQLLKRYNFIKIEKEGHFNTYIVNPDIAWHSEKEFLKQCKFPRNLSVNTPCQLRRVFQKREDSNDVCFKLAKQMIQLMYEQHYIDDMALANKQQLKLKKELLLLAEHFNDSIVLKYLNQITSEDNKS